MARRRRGELAGDLLARAMREGRISFALGGPLDERERSGSTDPQSVVEFLAYDIPFETETAAGMTFPPEAHPPRKGKR